MRRRLPLVAVVFLAVVGVAAIGFSSKGESARESMPEVDPSLAHGRSPCDQRVIVIAPESFVLPRDMRDVLGRTVEVTPLPIFREDARLLRVAPPDVGFRTRLRETLHSLRDKVVVERDAVSPPGFAFDAEECRQ